MGVQRNKRRIHLQVTVTIAAQPAVTYGEELRLHVLKLGVNYKFW